MDAAGAALPEFDGLGNDAIAAPERREWNFTVFKLGFEFLDFLQEDFSGGDHF